MIVCIIAVSRELKFLGLECTLRSARSGEEETAVPLFFVHCRFLHDATARGQNLTQSDMCCQHNRGQAALTVRRVVHSASTVQGIRMSCTGSAALVKGRLRMNKDVTFLASLGCLVACAWPLQLMRVAGT